MKLKTSLSVFIGLALSLFTQAAETKRPNILFIIVDDQSPLDLQIYNSKSILETPVISKLASEGMTLDGAHHMKSFSGAVCNPSRHMVMCGRTVWHLPNATKLVGEGHCPEGICQYHGGGL